MKKYVEGYKARKPVIDGPKRPPPNWQEYDIGYSLTPDWIFTNRQEAEIECAVVQNLKPHVGPHYCNLAVEALLDGSYGIACEDHISPAVE